MITLATYSVEYILPLIGAGFPKTQFNTEYGNFLVKTSTLRLLTFKNNIQCVSCGCYGRIFKLQTRVIGPSNNLNCNIENCYLCANKDYRNQRGRYTESPHLNMYHLSKKGATILMTRDHIIPLSKGGPDTLENLQTMCTYCNSRKGSLMPDEFKISLKN